jgi:hypothetical protein
VVGAVGESAGPGVGAIVGAGVGFPVEDDVVGEGLVVRTALLRILIIVTSPARLLKIFDELQHKKNYVRCFEVFK